MAQLFPLTPVSSSVPAPHCSVFLLSSSLAMSPADLFLFPNSVFLLIFCSGLGRSFPALFWSLIYCFSSHALRSNFPALVIPIASSTF